jgi:DNA-binding beta-propeller fold protein YncE
VAINYSTGDHRLWVVDGKANSVTRYTVVSPTQLTKYKNAIPVGRGPKRLTSTRCCLWVANFGDGTVTKILAKTGTVVSPPITIGGHPDPVTTPGDGYVWVAVWSEPTSGDGPPGRVKRFFQ